MERTKKRNRDSLSDNTSLERRHKVRFHVGEKNPERQTIHQDHNQSDGSGPNESELQVPLKSVSKLMPLLVNLNRLYVHQLYPFAIGLIRYHPFLLPHLYSLHQYPAPVCRYLFGDTPLFLCFANGSIVIPIQQTGGISGKLFPSSYWFQMVPLIQWLHNLNTRCL